MNYEEKLQERRARLLARAERVQAAGEASYRQARQMGEAIPFGQPMLVDHYSYGRDVRYRARIAKAYDRAFGAFKEAERLGEVAHGVGRHGISSDDENAVDKLTARVAALRARQETMKRRNKIARRTTRSIEAREAELIADGMTAEAAHELLCPRFAYMGQGYPSFTMSNNLANVKRLEERLRTLTSLRAMPVLTGETRPDGVRWFEDRDENRVCVEFPGKPAPEVISQLKRSGFRWSPRFGRWQRQTSVAAVRLAQQFVKEPAVA